MDREVTVNTRISCLALFAVLAVAGCNRAAESGQVGKADAVELAGTSWHLASVGGEPVTAAPSDRTPPTLRFGNEGKATGSGGCNQYGSSYSRDGSNLAFGPIGATKMACPAVMDLENAYFSALQSTQGYRLKDDSLILLDGEGRELARLTRAAAAK